MKEYLLIVYVAIYGAGDVVECSDVIVCPLNCFYDCVDMLLVDVCVISGDV